VRKGGKDRPQLNKEGGPFKRRGKTYTISSETSLEKMRGEGLNIPKSQKGNHKEKEKEASKGAKVVHPPCIVHCKKAALGGSRKDRGERNTSEVHRKGW